MQVHAEYSARQLEETPERVARLVWGLVTLPEVIAVMEQRGFDRKELEYGQTLLIELLRQLPAPVAASEWPGRAREALVRIDSWDEPTYARTAAIARRFNPDAGEYIFGDGLRAGKGLEAAQNAARYLARVQALESGSDPARKGKADKDREFVALLEGRGLTHADRQEMASLVEVVLSPQFGAAAAKDAGLEKVRQEKLVALRAWYDEWVTTLRTLITKRSQLIRLGLAKRRNGKEAEIVDETPPASTDAPVTPETPPQAPGA